MSVPEANISYGTINKKVRNLRSTLRRFSGFFLLILSTVIMLMPVWYMLVTSLKSDTEILKFPPTLFPSELKLENFMRVFEKVNFGAYYLNSLFIAVLVVIGTIISSTYVGFGFSRYRVKEKNLIFMILLSTLMLPLPAIIIPQYLMFRNFGWIDSFKPLIIPAFFGSAYNIFLIRQFFSTLPDDLFDAARIDGSSEVRTWWNIAIPLCKPALATIGIFQFLWTWNDYISPIIYINSEEKFTLTIGMAGMISVFRVVPWNILMAASIFALIPIMLIFFFLQKYFVEGIVLTGLK